MKKIVALILVLTTLFTMTLAEGIVTTETTTTTEQIGEVSGDENQVVNPGTPTEEQNEEAPAAPAEEQQEETPAAPAEEQQEETPAAPAEEQKEETPAAPAEEQKEETPAAPAEEQKEETPAAPAEEQKEETPAAPAEEQKEETPAAPAEEQTEETPAAPAEEQKEETPAAPAEEQKEEAPTEAPVVTDAPTAAPTEAPTAAPTAAPTKAPVATAAPAATEAPAAEEELPLAMTADVEPATTTTAKLTRSKPVKLQKFQVGANKLPTLFDIQIQNMIKLVFNTTPIKCLDVLDITLPDVTAAPAVNPEAPVEEQLVKLDLPVDDELKNALKDNENTMGVIIANDTETPCKLSLDENDNLSTVVDNATVGNIVADEEASIVLLTEDTDAE